MVAQRLTTEGEYRSQIIEAERYARQIPQVKALMYFVYGYEGQWGTYNHDEAFARTLTAPLLALGGDMAAFEAQLGLYMQGYVIPQNPAAAFYAYGRAHGWEPISPEVDYQGYRCQVWYSAADQMQHVVYCLIGDWGNLHHFDRDN